MIRVDLQEDIADAERGALGMGAEDLDLFHAGIIGRRRGGSAIPSALVDE
jgi:hypothetical protein